MKTIYFSLILEFAFVSLSAQVPVSKEPRHHPVFVNEKIRILNVLLPPGDTTLYHLHSTPSVFISLSETKTGSQLFNEQAAYSNSVPGNIWFENLSAPHTRIHRVWNMDTSTFHVVDIELLFTNPGFTQKPLLIPHAQLLIDTPWVRAYKIELKKTEKVTIHEKRRSFIVIAIKNEAHVILQNGKQVKDGLQKGEFIRINPGDSISITNQQDSTGSLALFEIK